MKNKFYIIIILCSLLLASCSPKPSDVRTVNQSAPIYPDYTDVAIPYNIAPLNFLLRDGADAVEVKVTGRNKNLTVYGKEEVRFSMSDWKALLNAEKGNTLTVQVTARVSGKWLAYKPFTWYVAPDAVDGYLTYRLIEPGYEVWNSIQLCERNVESFDEKVLIDNNMVNNSCMNCHTHGNQSGNLSFFHLRDKKGGTILNRDGKLRKLALKVDGMVSGCVYGEFHPSGRYGAFSTNVIIPSFHTLGSKRLEVYDTASDVVVADFDRNQIISSPLLNDSTVFETFPVFSADGKFIYYCSAPRVKLPEDIKNLKYSLCRIPFDAQKGIIGNKVDTLWNARLTGKSVCFPKASPDGKYLLYTVADYGTFPIWHREADLQLMDLQTGQTDDLKAVNSNRSDTYHSWSSNSRWFVFASKRGDGQYGKPYFCYIDKKGKAYKPFVLPQEDPTHYDNTLKSYNIPDLSKSPVPFEARDIESIFKNKEAEKFH
jgi:hypothetical protein